MPHPLDYSPREAYMSGADTPFTIMVEPLAARSPRLARREGSGVGVITELGPRDGPAPDLIQPVVGFRNWRIYRSGSTAGELCSPQLPVVWSEPVLRAECRRRDDVEELVREPHEAPWPGCGCGISACHEPTGASAEVDFRAVPGIVTVWGRIEVERHEMRAQLARVEALALYQRWARRQQDAVRQVAGALGVDLVDPRELGAAARSYGEAMPAALLQREDRPPGIRDRFAAVFGSRVGD